MYYFALLFKKKTKVSDAQWAIVVDCIYDGWAKSNAHRWKIKYRFFFKKKLYKRIESDAIRKFAHANAASERIGRID